MIVIKENIIMIGCILFCMHLKAQDSFINLKKENNKKFEIYDQNNIKKAEITSSSGKIHIKANLSPDSKYIAVIESPENYNDYNQPNVFKILSQDGIVLDILDDDVRLFKWNNKSDNIAIITGKYNEGNIGFTPEKVLIFNQVTKKKNLVSISSKKFWPYDISWGYNDSILYIKTSDLTIYEYNLTSKSLGKSKYFDFNFSPDGKYYYQEHSAYFRKEFAVYETLTNKKVQLNSMISILNKVNHKNEYGKLIGWTSDKEHVLLYKKVIEENEYRDYVLPNKDPNDKTVKIYRKNISHKLTAIKYRFYDVVLNKEIKEFETDGEENEFITNPKKVIYKEKGSGKFKKLKF